MSTVVGNGIRYAAPSIDEALRDLRLLKAKIQSIYEALATRHIARIAAEAIDIARHGGTRAESAMMEAWTQFQDHEAKATKSPYPSVFDFTFEVGLVPVRGALYGTVHTCITEFRQALRDSGIAAEYNYWDNADPLEGLGAGEWRERERVWDEIMALDPLSRPGRAGLLYDLTPHFFVPDSAGVAAAIPDPSARSNALADHIARGMEEGLPAKSGKTLMEAAREGRALRDSLMPELEAGLVPIRKEDLV